MGGAFKRVDQNVSSANASASEEIIIAASYHRIGSNDGDSLTTTKIMMFVVIIFTMFTKLKFMAEMKGHSI